MQEQMTSQIPVGSIISAIVWILIPAILLFVLIWFTRDYKNKIAGGPKKTNAEPDVRLLKELQDSYNKLTDEQKRKIDSIK